MVSKIQSGCHIRCVYRNVHVPPVLLYFPRLQRALLDRLQLQRLRLSTVKFSNIACCLQVASLSAAGSESNRKAGSEGAKTEGKVLFGLEHPAHTACW